MDRWSFYDFNEFSHDIRSFGKFDFGWFKHKVFLRSKNMNDFPVFQGLSIFNDHTNQRTTIINGQFYFCRLYWKPYYHSFKRHLWFAADLPFILFTFYESIYQILRIAFSRKTRFDLTFNWNCDRKYTFCRGVNNLPKKHKTQPWFK